MSVKRTKLQDRYELREILGRGGMGVVYKAYDRLMNREVALKTILDIDKSENLALFYKEWSTLVTMVHPHVINIYDIGEFEQDGVTKPFFVMPLLPGVTLDKLIREGSPRLSVKGVIDIIEQACRGLHAAHEQGLIHRDVKPSNIFVMDDGSVKIIDFGIARSVSAHSTTTLKGTLYYMAPEQLEMKPATPLSDQFALAVVTYEALTRRRPFQGPSERQLIEALRHSSPPPVSELNHEASYAISQVVHKALAKQPSHRFFNMREYGETLLKAFRNEPLDYLDSSKIKPRLERAAQSFEQGDHEFASEVLSELEAEGHLDQGIALLRGQVDQAVRQIRIKQMLENARRFFQAGEYPLALRKIEETLELDPNEATALSLKSQVERQRRETKISEWITIARQHLDNQAFRQARDALDNILQLKPSETEALQLMAEVGRREREVARIREEKGVLYQAAIQAWEKGEISSALTKLEGLMAMERDMPESDTSRGSGYQSFYNRVHSEHNSLKSAYDEARRYLSTNNFEGALAICKQNLGKYPNHALFQALMFDVVERERQNRSAVIAETDRRVENEPDLDRRAGILDEAMKLYPGEPHFERAMELVRSKRDLVNSIVAKARFFEERGQFTEALDQWQILKSIHEQHPGLAFEIERLIKRRDQQARHNSKARWVEQADKYLESGDYDRAMKTVDRALAEFPGEAELLELQKLVRKNQELAQQALQLLSQARESIDKSSVDQGALERGLDLVREAHRLDPRNAVIRTVLVNTLLDQARRSVDTNWEEAHAAVQEVLAIDPNHAPAKSLAAEIDDRKREDSIVSFLAKARRLQTEGDLPGALALAGEGLNAHPQEPRLHQLQATLQRAQGEAQRQQLAAPPRQRNDPQATPLPPPRPPLPPIPIAVSAAEPAPEIPARKASEPSDRKRNLAVLGAAAVLIVLVAGGIYTRLRPHPAVAPVAAPPAKIKVTLRSSPPGSEISVNGAPCGNSSCEIELSPGEYQAEARLADYLPATVSFHVDADRPTPPEIDLKLSAIPPLITISTDLAQGSVRLDNVEASKIEGREIEIPKLTPGSHTLFIENGAFRASVPLEISADAIPKVNGRIQTQGMSGFAIVHSGDSARLYGSVAGLKVKLDGNEAGMLSADGLDLKDLGQRSHEVEIEEAGGHVSKLVFDSGPATAILLSLVTNRNLGVLDILTTEDGADVYLNGEKMRGTTKSGRLRLYLFPKTYSVRVQKQGAGVSADQSVVLRSGEEAKLEVKLIPQEASLNIHHGLPGSEIRLDGNRLGIVRPDGEFSAAHIEPGKHTIFVGTPGNDLYRPMQTDQAFVAGKSTEIEGALRSLAGTLKIELNPAVPDAHLRLRRQGESQDREIRETALNLPEGSYTVSASATGYQDAVSTVRVTAENSVTANLALNKVAAAPAAPPPATIPVAKETTFLLEDWLKLGQWNREGSALTRQGGDFVIAPVDLRQGAIQFTVSLIRGKRLEWVLGYRDLKNYALFQIDGSNFERASIADGKRDKPFRVPYTSKRGEPITISIAVSPKSIVHSIPNGPNKRVLDDWEPSVGMPAGKFGFHIPGRDEIGLTDFRLTTN
ncbi:MAG: protein kinase [Bryobacteraceae bacterium]